MSEATANHDPVWSAQAAHDSLRHVSPESPCAYLPGRMARHEAYLSTGLDDAGYTMLLAKGFRRSGGIVYRPRCRGCHECRQVRVLTQDFLPTRSMRRVLRRNADIRVEEAPPVPTAEKFAMFTRYLDGQHDGTMSRDLDSFVGFLYQSPLRTSEFHYYLGDRIIGISLADRCEDGLSSVYMYFDPNDGRRSLGTFSVLWEIDYCRRNALAYYYLGYYVAGSRTMAYKSRFRPLEVLVADDRWMALPG